ncbi:MAG TPA: glycosyltransferase family 4 protein [Candidatus Koribacter sp.]
MNTIPVLHVLNTAAVGASAIARSVRGLALYEEPGPYQISACFLQPGPLAADFERAGIETFVLSWSGKASRAAAAMRYWSLVRRHNFAIIHQHLGGRVLTEIGRRARRAKTVIHVHSAVVETSDTPLAASLLPACDRVVANSYAVAREIGIPNAQVIYYGVDAGTERPRLHNHERVVLGTACRLEPVRRVSRLLETLAILKHDAVYNFRLQIAGDGTLRSALEAQAQQLGVAQDVEFLGWCDDMQSVMANWDIYVTSPRAEGFGMAVMDAMAAGLPVVARNVGGLPELILQGQTGLLVNEDSAQAFASAIASLAADETKRVNMGSAGRRRILAEFSVRRNVQSTVRLYDELLNSGDTDRGAVK